MVEVNGYVDSSGNTALHTAAQAGRALVVEWLVEEGGASMLQVLIVLMVILVSAWLESQNLALLASQVPCGLCTALTTTAVTLPRCRRLYS